MLRHSQENSIDEEITNLIEENSLDAENKHTDFSSGVAKIGLHSIKNILGDSKQLNLFNKELIREFSKTYGITLENAIDRYGVDLNETQFRVMEGILRGFTETNYEGNHLPKDKRELAKEKYQSHDLPPTYKYTTTIPRLIATQSQILDWAGFSKTSIAVKERVIEALNFLGTTQFCFYYDRLVYDEKGNPKKNSAGGWIKEEVTAVDTLFTIKEVREEKSKKLRYYEILPSPIFLDQRESYFMLIPFGWREEVQKVLGKKRFSSYTLRFLLFLRYQYEIKRRSKQSLELRKTTEEVAIALKMPEAVYRRKKDRLNQTLEEAYAIAKALGYLTDYKRENNQEIFYLREEKYYNPNRFLEIDKEDVNPLPAVSAEAKGLFQFFYDQKRLIDPKLKVPIGTPRNLHTRSFDQLLKDRSIEDIKSVIQWSLSKSYWCARVGTPLKLKEHFSDAWSEMLLSSSNSKEDRMMANKKFANDVYAKIKSKIPKDLTFEVLNKWIELYVSGGRNSIVIPYEEKNFREDLEKSLQKYGIRII